MKFIQACLATLLFLIGLAIIYSLHSTFFKVDVLLYSAIGDGLLATGMAAIILWRWRYLASLNRFEKFQLCLTWLLISYIFAISVPALVDRSLSFYLLEKIQQRGGGIRLENIEEVFTKEYVREHRLLELRLTEQQQSGTISIENGCVKLTDRGRLLATTSRHFRQHFLPKKRLLMGQYTDDLTDPFRHGHPHPDYTCR